LARRALTGILLVGGASVRFGSPKALADVAGETLAARAWRVLGEVSAERVAVGKADDRLHLPFPLFDDGTPVRAPIAGVVAGLRRAANDLSVVLPVDCPLMTSEALLTLADACADAAVPQTGPLPAAIRRSALPELERRLASGRLSLKEAFSALDTRVVELDPRLLLNVNTPAELPD
jgi:molybdenum cofactor guanylyltransferase